MKLQKQLFRHDPTNGVYGDCYRTCLACLLDLEPQSIPHITQREFLNEELFNQHFRDALLELGYVEAVTIYSGQSLNAVLAVQKQLNPNLLYILQGLSRNEINHVVIGQNDKIIWDPSLDNSGIIGPCLNGYYYVTHLVQTRFLNVVLN